MQKMSKFETTGGNHTHSGETITPGQETLEHASAELVDAVKDIITKEEYDSLCKKEELTDEEFTSVIDYSLAQSMMKSPEFNFLKLNIKTISSKKVFELYRLYRKGKISKYHPEIAPRRIELDNLENLENWVAWALWKFAEVSIKKATIETADQGAHFINVWRLTVWGIKQAAWDVIYKYNKKLREFRIWEDVIVKRGEWISSENSNAAARHWIIITHAWQFFQ